MKSTLTNDHNHIHQNLNNTSSLFEDEILREIKNECGHMKCVEPVNLFKYDGNLIELQEEEYYENCIGTIQKVEGEEEDEERDLTNLAWLTELRNQSMSFVNIALEEEKISEQTSGSKDNALDQPPTSTLNQLEEESVNVLGRRKRRIVLQMNEYKSELSNPTKVSSGQLKRPSPSERYELFLHKIKRDLEMYQQSALNYQSDIVEKPPFNYSHIIGMAMLENGRRVTLQQICSWIERKFAFFRVRKKWNNSIRHNLSLHPCFRKIGRNKEDKGKGGYWELGVDPKKCERKRIRNRKSSAQKSSAQPIKVQKKHTQTHYIKTTKKRHQNLATNKKLNIKSCNSNSKQLSFNTDEVEYEELLLDDMDVQQNIDVTSSITNNVDVNNLYFYYKNSDLPSDIADEVNGYTNRREFCNKSTLDYYHPDINQLSEQSCEQHYKLGTIIITSTSMAAEMPNIQNLNPRSINSFLTTNSLIKQPTEEPSRHSVHNTGDGETFGEGVLISSCTPNCANDYTNCTHGTKSCQCHSSLSTCSKSPIRLDFSAFSAQTAQPKPNVIAEQLIQPTLNVSAIGISTDYIPRSLLSTTTHSCTIETQAMEYPNGLLDENFHPYIDGIDEAFQYLRSIDNARNEDILDNLLDISVSDY